MSVFFVGQIGKQISKQHYLLDKVFVCKQTDTSMDKSSENKLLQFGEYRKSLYDVFDHNYVALLNLSDEEITADYIWYHHGDSIIN